MRCCRLSLDGVSRAWRGHLVVCGSFGGASCAPRPVGLVQEGAGGANPAVAWVRRSRLKDEGMSQKSTISRVSLDSNKIYLSVNVCRFDLTGLLLVHGGSKLLELPLKPNAWGKVPTAKLESSHSRIYPT